MKYIYYNKYSNLLKKKCNMCADCVCINDVKACTCEMYEFERFMFNVNHKKILCIKNDMSDYENNFGIIKSIVGDDTFCLLNTTNNNYFISCLKFQTIY